MAEPGTKLRKVLVGIIGGLVLMIGIIAIPYPGPGWLIVFTGLAILSTEFTWAERVLHFARKKYDAWSAWLLKQSWWVRLLVASITAIIVVATLWLLNVYGMFNDWFNLGQNWVESPFFSGR